MEPMAISKGLPGVLGALPAAPNDANAPDPRPNALEPPPVGEARPLPGVVAENGLGFPWDEVGPPLRRAEARDEKSLAAVEESVWLVARDRLLVLNARNRQVSQTERRN